MFVIKGRFNEAVVYANNIDSETKTQIKHLLDQEFVKNSIIRIMPDCHAGIGCVIGTTMTITDKIVPNLVGVDIGCGMLTIKLGKIDIIYKNLDITYMLISIKIYIKMIGKKTLKKKIVLTLVIF